MKKIKPGYWFLISWLAVNSFIGQWNNFGKPPHGMHQGAQIDRATIAWNYYNLSMNFFEPRVMENRAHQGIVGMEFPIVNYTAAVFYKIFGPHEFWYRLLVFLIISCGVFSAWLITSFFVQKIFTRLIIVYSWYLSPIFIFYSASFIPDPVALSFSMISLYFFFRFYFNIKIKSSILSYTLFITLSGLIKITFLISHFAIAFLFLLYRFKPHIFPNGFPSLRYAWFWFGLPLLPIFGWYSYARILTDKTQNIHFLQQIKPANNLQEFADNTAFGFNTWHDSIYAPNYFYILIVIFLIVALFHPRNKEFILPLLLAITLLGGFIASFILFNFQYRYHDYYYHLLFPALFFIFLFLQQIFVVNKMLVSGIFPVLMIIAFYWWPYKNIQHAKKMLHHRYEEGNYFCQESFSSIRQYEGIDIIIDRLIPKNAIIASAFDPTPNSTLYFMRRQGLRIASDFGPELTKDIIKNYKVEYLILNDSARWKQTYHDSAEKLTNLYSNNGITIWKRTLSTK